MDVLAKRLSKRENVAYNQPRKPAKKIHQKNQHYKVKQQKKNEKLEKEYEAVTKAMDYMLSVANTTHQTVQGSDYGTVRGLVMDSFNAGSSDDAKAVMQDIIESATQISSRDGGATGNLETKTTALNQGISTVQQLRSVVGKGNGARDLITATTDSLVQEACAMICMQIVKMVHKIHPISHPLYVDIFKRVFSKQLQHIPEHIQNEVGELTSVPDWFDPLIELSEYFDFVQAVFGGAMAEVWKMHDLMTKLYHTCSGKNWKDTKIKVDVSVEIDFPPPPQCVPLMSIQKQVNDVMNKIMLLKEICKNKAKLAVESLSHYELPDLKLAHKVQSAVNFADQTAGKAVTDIKETTLSFVQNYAELGYVVMEVIYIYQHISIVIDKILYMFLNQYVSQFTQKANEIIKKVLKTFKDVIEIVPPLEDLVNLMFEIPQQGDICVNAAFNVALPNCWGMIQPYLSTPLNCLGQINKMCDAATKIAFKDNPPK